MLAKTPILVSVLGISLTSIQCQTDRPQNELPMFGTPNAESVDKSISKSRLYADLAWKALDSGDSNDAIKRFNQAWLYDKLSAEPYWGFGIVCGKRALEGEDTEKNMLCSVDFLKQALKLSAENPRILVDLATSEYNLAGYFQTKNKTEEMSIYLSAALKHLKQAQQLDPSYPLLYKQLVLVYQQLGMSDEIDKLHAQGMKYNIDISQYLKTPNENR